MAGFARRDAVMGNQEARLAGQALLLAHRRALQNQADRARAASTVLVERYLRAVAHSLAVRGQAAEAYADARIARQAVASRRRAATTGQDAAPSLDGFEVAGLIDGRPVVATWTRGRLVCDPALWSRAELLVDLEEVFSDEAGWPRHVASLEGPAVAVALTLLRACDRVVGFCSVKPMPPGADWPDPSGAATP